MTFEVMQLEGRVSELEAENHRLRLVIALLRYKPPLKARGRPKKSTLDQDIQLLDKVEKLQVRWGFKTRMAVLRHAQQIGHNSIAAGKFKTQLKLKIERDNLQKELSAAKKAKISSNN